MNWKAHILLAASIALLGVGCTGEISSGGPNVSSDDGDTGQSAMRDVGSTNADGSSGGQNCTFPPCADTESEADAGGDAESAKDVDQVPDTVDAPDSQQEPDPDPDAGAEPDTSPQPDPITPTVSILSPNNGATVQNPVDFSIAAEHVSTVQIKVDDWPLSAPWNPTSSTTLRYTFNGTGTPREVILYGYDGSGAEVARDTISITIEDDAPPPRPGKGTSIGSFINTYYYVEDESDFSGPKTAKFYDKNCSVIATVRSDFASLACIEGTAKLSDGRMLNYYNGTNCGGACSFTWSEMSSAFPWGKGSRGNALEPLRSWAVDTSIISSGSVLYVEEWDGMAIPTSGTLGGYTHDGCFRADDVGGGINGRHVDIFAGSKGMYRKLNALFPTRTSFTVYKNSPRCAHL